MANATFRIWRTQPGGGGAFQDYTTEVSEGMVVLDAVHRIQADQAPTTPAQTSKGLSRVMAGRSVGNTA